jgi:hypothetical protein
VGAQKKVEKLPAADQADPPTPRADTTVPSAITAPTATAPVVNEVDVNPWGRRIWFDADWLHWWTRSGPLNYPLVVTGSLADPRPGVIGQPGTVPLFDGPLGYSAANGVRLGAGIWLDGEQRYGIEARGFLLNVSRLSQSFASNGDTILTRPFFDTTTNDIQTFDIARPDVLGRLAGTFTVNSTSRLGGGEINFRDNLLRSNWFSVSGIAGVRYLCLTETLDMSEIAVNMAPGFIFTGTPVPINSVATFNDSFGTRNQFYGGQLGARLEGKVGRIIIGLDGKLAMGVNNQQINIVGASSVVQPDGVVRTSPGGVLAQPTNMGQFNSSHFSLVPEVGVDLGLQVTSWMQVRVGYNFLYWTEVIRPGGQLDPVLNGNQVPGVDRFGMFPGGPARPAVLFNQDHYWAQGLSVGLRFTY